MNEKQLGTIYALLSGICWGTFGIFSTKLIQLGIDKNQLVAIAPFVLMLYFLIVVLRDKSLIRGIPLKRIIVAICIMGVLNCMAILCYTYAYANKMPAGIVSSVAFCNVVIVLIGSYFAFGMKITLKKVFCIMFAILGVIMVLGLYDLPNCRFSWQGLFWTVLIPIFYGANVIANKYYVLKGIPALTVILILSTGSFVFSMFIYKMTPVTIITDLVVASVNNTEILLWLLGFCLIPQILCYYFMAQALKRVAPVVFSLCYSAEPVTAILLGYLVFSNQITRIQWIGMVIIIIAVGVSNIREKDRQKVEKHIKDAILMK